MTGKGKIRDIQIKSQIHLEQQLIFVLFKKYIFSLEGKEISEKDGTTEEYIAKSSIIQALCEMLNDYCGEIPMENNETIIR